VLIYAAALCFGQTDASPGAAPQANAAGQEAPQSSDGQSKPPAPAAAPDARPGPSEATPAVVPAQPPADPPKAVAPAKSAGTAAQPGHKPYVIGPLDVIEVNVWNAANLSHMYDVSSDGTISMPLIGLVKADGLTQTELSAAIAQKLLAVAFQNAPDVNVQVTRNNSKKYSILGAVGKPGEYPLNGETTVLDAFANCGSFQPFANTKKIRILRNIPGAAAPKKFLFNYKDVSQGKHMEQNIVLENGDHIFVDE
jgi:polysaccharide export outer membrane protein